MQMDGDTYGGSAEDLFNLSADPHVEKSVTCRLLRSGFRV